MSQYTFSVSSATTASRIKGALLALAGKGTDRNLQCLGLFIGPHGLTLAATDGKFLVEHVVHCHECNVPEHDRDCDSFHSLLISKKDAQAVAAMLTRTKSQASAKPALALSLTVESDRLTIGDYQASLVVPLQSGAFPNYKGAIPSHGETMADVGQTRNMIGISAVYLSKLDKALAIPSQSKHKGLTMSLYGVGRGMIFKPIFESYTDGSRLAMLMPITLPS